MYCIVSFGHVIVWILRVQSRNFELFSRPFVELFSSIFEHNCCGCTVVCEWND